MYVKRPPPADWEDTETDDDFAEESKKQKLTSNLPELEVSKCTTCQKAQDDVSVPLKWCAKCKKDLYCSQECQKADWKRHKKSCGAIATGTTQSNTTTNNTTHASSSSGKLCSIENPFTALKDGTWLKDRSKKDVYQLLIDVYRLRLDDDFKFKGKYIEMNSLIGGGAAIDALRSFKEFLLEVNMLNSKRRKTKRVLPDWWTNADIQACLEVAKKSRGWSYIGAAVERSDVRKHYDDFGMPNQLRMFGEALDGYLTAGESGKKVLESMVMTEQGSVQSVMLDEPGRRTW